MCFSDSSGNDHHYIGCFESVILDKLSFLFTIIIVSLYVVNNIVYMFGSKYISLKRILVECIIEGFYCLVLTKNETDLSQWLWCINVLLIIIIILDMVYYIANLCCYDGGKSENRFIISKKVMQCLGVIAIMMGTYDLILDSFSYYSCIEALHCLIPAVYLLFEPLLFVDEKRIDATAICVV